MLHIVTDSPFTHTTLQCCLKYFDQGDSLVLAGDAVIAACVSQYQKLLENYQVFVMADDITARGLSLKTGLTINYQELVRLVADLDSPVCW